MKKVGKGYYSLFVGVMFLIVVLLMASCSDSNNTEETEVEADEDFPEKTINIYSPYSPGGYADIITRAVAEGLEDELGVNVNVSDESGGGGIVAMTDIVNQEPDGYTLSAATDISHMHFEDVDYEVDDFTYIATTAYAHHPVMVREDSDWDDMDDLLEYAKDNPGSLKWGSGGIVNPVVLAGRELFAEQDIEAEQVPYDGGSEVLSALLSGDIDVGIIADFKSALDAGDIKLLAESSQEEDPNYPEVKTLSEEGYIDEGPPTVYGLVGPKDIPDNVVELINEKVNEILESEDFEKQMDDIGVEAYPKSPEEYQEIIFEEDKRLAEVVPKYSEEGDDEE